MKNPTKASRSATVIRIAEKAVGVIEAWQISGREIKPIHQLDEAKNGVCIPGKASGCITLTSCDVTIHPWNPDASSEKMRYGEIYKVEPLENGEIFFSSKGV
jgi:hypothetical protein